MCVCIAANHVEECARLLEELGVKAVAFDMDQTMVAAHSHARMSKARVQEDFVARVSPDFVKLAPLLAQRGIHLAVATHSDRREHTDAVRCARLHNGGGFGSHCVCACQTPPETHLLGEDLAEVVVRSVLPTEISRDFCYVGYNPKCYGAEGELEENLAKIRHVRIIADHFGVKVAQVALFDDVQDNIDTTSVFHAFLVDGTTGFTAEGVNEQIRARLAGAAPTEEAHKSGVGTGASAEAGTGTSAGAGAGAGVGTAAVDGETQ